MPKRHTRVAREIAAKSVALALFCAGCGEATDRGGLSTASSQAGGSGVSHGAAGNADSVGSHNTRCELTDCAGITEIRFTYSCGSPSRKTKADYFYTPNGVRTGVTFTATYGNGHVVECESIAVDAGRSQKCHDDTGAQCTW